MGTEKYVSDVQQVYCDYETVYDKLSNFETLNVLFNPENIARVKEQMKDSPDLKKMPDLDLEDFEADADSCSFKVKGLGRLGMRIVERDPKKSIKITGDGTVPFPFTIWVQILPSNTTTQSKIRLTVHAELNMMMKMMVGKKLGEGINKVAEGIARIPYASI